MPFIHSKNLNVSRSLSAVRSDRLRGATMPARTALSSTVKFLPPHKHRQAGPQNTMGIAMLHLAGPPPITIGTILRPLNLSPVWSYISCECPVVEPCRTGGLVPGIREIKGSVLGRLPYYLVWQLSIALFSFLLFLLYSTLLTIAYIIVFCSCFFYIIVL